MKKILFILISSILLTACYAPQNYFRAVEHTYDEVKQEKLSKYEMDAKAVSIWKKSSPYFVHLTWLHKEKTGVHQNNIGIFFDLERDKKVEDTLYFVLSEKIYPVAVSQIFYEPKEVMKTRTETEVVKPEDKKEKEKIITDVHTHSFVLNRVKIKAEIPQTVIEELKRQKKMKIRLYIEEQAYDIKIPSLLMKKIKKIFN